VIVPQIVSERPTPKHRANGPSPSKHVEGAATLPQHRAEYVIKTHGGSLTSIRTRRAAQ
jgi:hypothetical protein